jgi:hypothetical protein
MPSVSTGFTGMIASALGDECTWGLRKPCRIQICDTHLSSLVQTKTHTINYKKAARARVYTSMGASTRTRMRAGVACRGRVQGWRQGTALTRRPLHSGAPAGPAGRPRELGRTPPLCPARPHARSPRRGEGGWGGGAQCTAAQTGSARRPASQRTAKRIRFNIRVLRGGVALGAPPTDHLRSAAVVQVAKERAAARVHRVQVDQHRAHTVPAVGAKLQPHFAVRVDAIVMLPVELARGVVANLDNATLVLDRGLNTF